MRTPALAGLSVEFNSGRAPGQSVVREVALVPFLARAPLMSVAMLVGLGLHGHRAFRCVFVLLRLALRRHSCLALARLTHGLCLHERLPVPPLPFEGAAAGRFGFCKLGGRGWEVPGRSATETFGPAEL